MTITGDTLRFSDGTCLYANNGIVGIGPELGVSEGSDGGLGDDRLTREQKAELADHMIELWRQYKEQK